MPATDRPTPSAPGPWPVKPGLKSIPESRLDHRPDSEILSSLQAYRPVTGEKNIWAFWHCGLSNSPPWVQRTVINWVRRLPTWSVRVLDSVPGSPTHFHHYITPALLPDALNKNTMTGPYVGTHSSDLIRLPLLYLYGGLWMDVGTLLFRDLDDICWSKLEDPGSPYELAGFLLPSGGTANDKTLLNSFIAARKGNPFVKRWHDIFLEVWRGVSECKGMHAHPLLKSILLFASTENDGTESDVPWSPSLPTEAKQDLADYGAQIVCFDRLLLLEDPSDGFSGSDYLAKHALFFDGMQEAALFQQLTGWDGLLQSQYLTIKEIPEQEEGPRDQRYLAAEQFAERVVRDSCQMKVSHGISSLGIRTLGRVWEEPGNEDADCAEGTFAAYLRYASVFLEQTREMKAQKMEPRTGKRLRVGLLEVGSE